MISDSASNTGAGNPGANLIIKLWEKNSASQVTRADADSIMQFCRYSLSICNQRCLRNSINMLCSILTSSSNWLFMKETYGVIARRRSEAVAI